MSVTLRREPVTRRSRDLVNLDLPNFAAGRLDWASVRQQELFNCPLPATLAATARVWPDQIRMMLSPSQELVHQAFRSWFDDRAQPAKSEDCFQGERLVGVNFFDGWQVKITPLLYSRPGHQNLWFAKCNDGSGWVSYIEKAYAVFGGKHRYEKLEELTVNRIFHDLLGRFDKIAVVDGKPDVFLDHDADEARANDDYTRGYLEDFLDRAEKRPTIATTYGGGVSLIPGHTYVVVARRGKQVELWEAMHNSTELVKLSDFFEEFDGVYQARKKPFKSS